MTCSFAIHTLVQPLWGIVWRWGWCLQAPCLQWTDKLPTAVCSNTPSSMEYTDMFVYCKFKNQYTSGSADIRGKRTFAFSIGLISLSQILHAWSQTRFVAWSSSLRDTNSDSLSLCLVKQHSWQTWVNIARRFWHYCGVVAILVLLVKQHCVNR